MTTRKLDDIIGELTAEDRREIDQLKAEMNAEHIAFQLGEVRKTRGLTQTELANILGKTQAAISAMESAQDHKISTVCAAIEAMDGRLELVAVFDDERIHLAS